MVHPERSYQGFGSRYRQNSFTYDVKRDVYNEETFHQEHRRKSASSGNVDINITTFSHHVHCRAASVAYGGSQTRDPIRAAAASLRHSHGNTGSEPHL